MASGPKRLPNWKGNNDPYLLCTDVHDDTWGMATENLAFSGYSVPTQAKFFLTSLRVMPE